MGKYFSETAKAWEFLELEAGGDDCDGLYD